MIGHLLGVPSGLGAGGSDGGAGGGGADFLPAGVYTADGDVSLPPYVGNYTLTTLLTDNALNDTTTGVTSGVAATQTVVYAYDTNASLTAVDQTKFYRGSMSQQWYKWDGTAWVSMTDTFAGAWAINNLSYTSASRQATFASEAAKYYRCVSTQSNTSSGNIQATDDRATVAL